MPTTPTLSEDLYAESEIDAASACFMREWPAVRYVRSEQQWVEGGHWITPQTVRRRLREARRCWFGGEEDVELGLRRILGVDVMPAPRGLEGESDLLVTTFRRGWPLVRYARGEKAWFEADRWIGSQSVRRRLREAKRAHGIRSAGLVEDVEFRLREILSSD